MDIKYNLQDLSELLARRNSVPRKDAETFVRVFFETISTFLLRDKIVKIKGLGTFKLVDVSDRESVDVNTGQRIVITGHAKVSFTPDPALRDLVNKPFMDFETVILNDGTDFEEMERIDEAVMPEESVQEESDADGAIVDEEVRKDEKPTEMPQPAVEEEAKPEKQQKMAEPEQQTSHEVPASVSTLEEGETQTEEVSGEDAAPESTGPETEPEPVTAEPVVVSTAEAAQRQPAAAEADKKLQENVTSGKDVPSRLFCWNNFLKFAVMALLMLGSYFVGYYRLLCPCNYLGLPAFTEKTEVTEVTRPKTVPDNGETGKQHAAKPVQTVENKTDTAHEDTPEEMADSIATEPEEQHAEDTETYPQVPGGKYMIVGTKGVHQMKVGDNLYRISRNAYGSIDMVKYIIVFNHFENPDVIPPGYEIKLPELKEVK